MCPPARLRLRTRRIEVFKKILPASTARALTFASRNLGNAAFNARNASLQNPAAGDMVGVHMSVDRINQFQAVLLAREEKYRG